MSNSRSIIVSCIIVLLANFAYTGVVVKYFRYESGLNQVTLKWVVTAESDVKGYNILRSVDGQSYANIKFIKADPNQSDEKSYNYIDNTVFKPYSRTFYYKLRFVFSDNTNQDYNKIVMVSPQISSARHTWGSIKAMFR